MGLRVSSRDCTFWERVRGPRAAPGRGGDPAQPSAPARTKSLTIGVTGDIPALSIAGPTTTTGGWTSLGEIHSDGLITADFDTHKQIGRLAEKVPSLDDGSIAVLADGRMRVTFTLRPGVTWHDGAPFTARDLVFSYRIGGPEGIPTAANLAVEYMSSVEAQNDSTFVIYYRQPYYLATSLGP